MAEFLQVAYSDEIRPGECKVVAVNSSNIALFNIGGKLYATENECPHKGGPLGDGCLDGELIKCPWHDWQFNVITGENTGSQNLILKTLSAVSKDGYIWVKI